MEYNDTLLISYLFWIFLKLSIYIVQVCNLKRCVFDPRLSYENKWHESFFLSRYHYFSVVIIISQSFVFEYSQLWRDKSRDIVERKDISAEGLKKRLVKDG